MTFFKSTAALCLAVSAGVALSANAYAAAPNLLDTLHENHVITDKQYQELKQQQEKQQQAWSKKPARPPAASAGGVATYLPHVGGELQVDGPIWVSKGGKLGQSTLLRRAYVNLYGNIGKAWKYKTQFGFINGSAGLSTGVISFVGIKPLRITAGYMKEPFSLDYMTSPTQLAFTERALPIALVPGKKIGLLAFVHGDYWTLAGGAFGAKYNSTPSVGTESRYGESVRGTFVPVHTGNFMWEVGGSAAYRVADSGHTFSFKSKPEENVVGADTVSTGTIKDANSLTSYGAETAMVSGPFSVQSEYIGTKMDRSSGNSNLNFDGWYVQGTWALNGKPRHFVPSKGVMVGVKPTSPVSAGGWGAWELAARYSGLDLNDASITGGDERDVTLGVNWYPEKRLRFTVDYTHVQPINGGAYKGIAANIVEARAQVVF